MFRVYILNAYEKNHVCPSVRMVYIRIFCVTSIIGLRRTLYCEACKVKFVYAFNSGSCRFLVRPDIQLKTKVTEFIKMATRLKNRKLATVCRCNVDSFSVSVKCS
jgi:hypothetical protein